MRSEELIQTLLEKTTQFIHQAEQLKRHDLNVLTWRKNEESWNILECLEHLNLYGEFYLPQIEGKIKASKTTADLEFKSGFLGNYFAKSMLPKGKLNKMKTFNDKNPLHANLDKAVIEKFIHQQHKLSSLLHQSKQLSLNGIRIPTSVSGLLRLKLGDTFQFFTNHIIRHLNQIENIQNDRKNN